MDHHWFNEICKNQEIIINNSSKLFDQANSRWDKLIQLILTLSISLLVGLIAFFNPLFTSNNFPIFIIISCIGFFSVILLSIGTLINEIIFYGNAARKEANKLLPTNIDSQTELERKPYVANNTILGEISITTFLSSILFLAAGLLPNAAFNCYSYLIILIGGISISAMLIYFHSIRIK